MRTPKEIAADMRAAADQAARWGLPPRVDQALALQVEFSEAVAATLDAAGLRPPADQPAEEPATGG